MSKPVLDEVLRRLEELPARVGLETPLRSNRVLPRHACPRPFECETCALLDEVTNIIGWARLEVVRQRLIFGEAKGPTL